MELYFFLLPIGFQAHFRSSIFFHLAVFLHSPLSVCCCKCNFVKLLLRPFQLFFTLSLSIPSDSATSFHISHEQKYQFPTFKPPLLISNILRCMLFFFFFCFSFTMLLTFAELFHFPPPQSLFVSLCCGGYQNLSNWYPKSALGSMMLCYFLVFPSSKCLQNEIL